MSKRGGPVTKVSLKLTALHFHSKHSVKGDKNLDCVVSWIFICNIIILVASWTYIRNFVALIIPTLRYKCTWIVIKWILWSRLIKMFFFFFLIQDSPNSQLLPYTRYEDGPRGTALWFAPVTLLVQMPSQSIWVCLGFIWFMAPHSFRLYISVNLYLPNMNICQPAALRSPIDSQIQWPGPNNAHHMFPIKLKLQKYPQEVQTVKIRSKV